MCDRSIYSQIAVGASIVCCLCTFGTHRQILFRIREAEYIQHSLCVTSETYYFTLVRFSFFLVRFQGKYCILHSFPAIQIQQHPVPLGVMAKNNCQQLANDRDTWIDREKVFPRYGYFQISAFPLDWNQMREYVLVSYGIITILRLTRFVRVLKNMLEKCPFYLVFAVRICQYCLAKLC